MDDVLVQLADGVGELILNRPERRNALTGPLVRGLTDGLSELTTNPECRVIIVRGAGGYFCAGLDLKAFSADPAPAWRDEFQADWARYHELVYLTELPIIGALEGFAIAGGSSLALSCDFLVAGESAFMHVSEVERNMLAPLNVFWLTRRYGYQVALRMGLLGERWSAPDLLANGLLERCVEDEAVVSTAMTMATRFASFDAKNLKALKRSIRTAAEVSMANSQFPDVLQEIKQAAE